jgi:cholesterol oxidase
MVANQACAVGYCVVYDRIAGEVLVRGEATARLVVLAAGSIGTTELLLRCRDEHHTLPALPARLGHGWSSNGDFLTPAWHPFRLVQPTRGPTITAAIDLLDGVVEGERIFVEDGGFPDIARDALLERATQHGRDGLFD